MQFSKIIATAILLSLGLAIPVAHVHKAATNADNLARRGSATNAQPVTNADVVAKPVYNAEALPSAPNADVVSKPAVNAVEPVTNAKAVNAKAVNAKVVNAESVRRGGY